MAISVHKRLRLARKRSGRKQREIAKDCNVQQASVARWEDDGPAGCLPSRDRWTQVAKAYGVPVSIFMPNTAS